MSKNKTTNPIGAVNLCISVIISRIPQQLLNLIIRMFVCVVGKLSTRNKKIFGVKINTIKILRKINNKK